MGLLSAMWHALPGWVWGGAGVSIAGLGLLAVFAPALFGNIIASVAKLIALIPWSKWQTWLVIGLVVGAFGFKVWLGMHDQAIAKAASDASDAFWKGQIKASNDRYVAQLSELQKWIDGQRANQQAKADALAAEAASERAKAQRAQTELDTLRKANVTAQAAAMCTLTRGVVLQFNAGAARANGGDDLAVAAASAAGGISVDSPAGVSLDTYTGAVESTQDALRACRAQVIGWQRYHSQVIAPWIASAIETVNRCTPKGTQ